MASPWAFGNTTVRNPLRIRSGLAALLDSPLNGYLIGKEQERQFAEVLDRAGVVEIRDRTRDYSDLGRKWRSCFSQLGFVTHKFDRATRLGDPEPAVQAAAALLPESGLTGPPFQVTPSGLRFIRAESVPQQQECMLRALRAYQVPSAIEPRNGETPFSPLYFVLQVLTLLLERSGRGLSDVEMAMLQTHRTHDPDGVAAAVDAVLAYRERAAAVTGTVARRQVARKTLEPLAAAMGVRCESLSDYADSNFRYLRYTGLFSYQGKRLVLGEAKRSIAEAILQRGPVLLDGDSPEYLARLWNGAPLPTDDEATAAGEIARYRRLLEQEGVPLADLPAASAGAGIADLNQIRLELEEAYQHRREEKYAALQCREPYLSETIATLKRLDGQKDEEARAIDRIDDKAAYLEWAVWRAFLAIGGLVGPAHEARRFRVDQDFYPMGCAPGRGPDMLFLFEEFALVVEVTLTSSSRQEAAEGEPVRRHVAVEKDRIGGALGLPVYGLFLAGTIDNNTAETFRIGVWYNGDAPTFLNIVPLTLAQFIRLMELFRQAPFAAGRLRQLLDSCLTLRNAHAPAWKREIETLVEGFLVPRVRPNT